jgi:hypothetical protein
MAVAANGVGKCGHFFQPVIPDGALARARRSGTQQLRTRRALLRVGEDEDGIGI